ncbi:beta-glucosidase H [Piscinibacter sp.]|jgi:beta-glucosidase|uniref:beta-glucosidase H n=1 Tax=Piscinibacter sp. TaxID=1903157 RepID=UPI0035599030
MNIETRSSDSDALAIDALLDAMTLREQVALLVGADFWTTVPVPRLGVPAFKVTDGPNGARGGSFKGGVTTACFPVGISLAATWNTALIREAGEALAVQARMKGASVLLAPTVNLHRSTLNGRNFECYSEDPWLAGEIGVAYIRGVQGQGVAATIKHFVGNESEYQRMTISSSIGERALRELYLLPFEKAVKEAGVWAVMSAYNRINGCFAGDHAPLIAGVLRGEWGFDGLVMSDWFATLDTVKAAQAGLDLEMPGPTRCRGEQLVQAVEAGQVDAGKVRAGAGHVLRLAQRVGAFDSPGIAEERSVDLPKHRALIRRLGAEGCVLLKNENALLPLAPAGQAPRRTLALIGPNAKTAQIMGGGSATVNALHRITPFQGIAAQCGAETILLHATGADNHRWVPVLNQPMELVFFNSTDFSGPEVLRKTYPSSEQMWAGAVEDGVDGDAFSARGALSYVAAADGEHQISLTSAGLCRCWLDGELLIDAWTNWQRGDTYFTFGCDEIVVTRRLRAGQRCEFTLEFSTATPEPTPPKAIRLGVHRPRGEAAIEQAVAVASVADAALVFVGLNAEFDNEGLDRHDMNLPHGQDELIRRVAAANPNTVVVLQTGAPVTMPWLDKVPALLQAWYPGQECGHAIADVLFGVADPGGRLPQTFPKRLADNPTFGDPRRYPGVDGEVRYDEGILIGYRHYEGRHVAPLFPFGHGLSYTRFEHTHLTLSASELAPGGRLEVSVDVTNRGERSGHEVVQLYLADRVATVERPPQELKAFSKLELAPGETGTARMSLDMRSFAFFDERRVAWVAEAGEFEIRVGASSQDIRQRAVIVLSADWVEPVGARASA